VLNRLLGRAPRLTLNWSKRSRRQISATAASAMRQIADVLSISTCGRGLVEITEELVGWLRPHAVETGLLTVFSRHTSAGLLIQENAARDVRADLETFFDRLAPEEAGRYRHAEEGDDDMPAHTPHGADGRAPCDSDLTSSARLGIVAGNLSLRAPSGASQTRNRRASDRRISRPIAAGFHLDICCRHILRVAGSLDAMLTIGAR
jgi:secondary thiamine-phosphate synthase enzyme